MIELAPRGVRWRRWLIWGIPAGVTAGWLGYVTAFGHWERVGTHWESTVTMIFGSFVAGSTPQGGGAVAFPVFTKVLDVPAGVARTFSLSIQSVGMVVASAIILLAGRRVEMRAVVTSGVAGMAGFAAALFVLGDPGTAFWDFRIDPAYVKVTFTIVLAAMSYIVWLALEEGDCGEERLPAGNRRVWAGIAIAGALGGVASALTGSGVDVFLFLFVVVLAGLHPRVGVPTSILAMAFVSTLGLVMLGLLHGQLAVDVDAAGRVIEVGRTEVATLSAARFDVFGLWLAAVPVVVWGAPLGTWLVHVLREGRLIAFVALMAAAEVLSTIVFLDELRTDPALLTFGVVGMAVAIGGVTLAAHHRHRLLKLEHAHLPG